MLTNKDRSDRYLIINADDFGISEKTNSGIIEAREKGVLTSASLMVLRPAAKAAAQYAASDRRFSVGLHVELGEWSYEQDQWKLIHERVNAQDSGAVALELRRQLERFRDLTGRNPTHVDSHQHIHTDAHLVPIFQEVAQELGVNLRSCGSMVQYCGAFFGADEYMTPRPEFVSSENLIHLIDQLPAGITEISTHPGWDMALESDYRDARLAEVHTLCNPTVRQAIADRGILLLSFTDLNSAPPRDTCE